MKKLLVVTNVIHRQEENKFYAYAPYVREMNIWFRHVEAVEVVAPASRPPKREKPPNLQRRSFKGEAYLHSGLCFTTIPSFDLLSAKALFNALFKIPIIFFKIIKAMHSADHLHMRCPGNVGLIACVAQIFFPTKIKSAKYAGNWDPKAKQPWSYRFQKWILDNTFLTRNMQVLVYGDWPNQSRNVRPFFTASFSEKEIAEVREKSFKGTFIFLFVGNLVSGKRPLKAIRLVEALQKKLQLYPGAPVIRLQIYGEGPERVMLEAYCKSSQLEDLVVFKGNRNLNELKEAYQLAHFLILPSISEGWPKAVAEAMFFGCIPVVSPVSCVPWMLEYGSRGILIRDKEGKEENIERRENKVESGEWKEERQDDEVKDTVESIIKLINNHKEMRRMSLEAQEWSQEYTLEKFEGAIKEILGKSNIKRVYPRGRGGRVG